MILAVAGTLWTAVAMAGDPAIITLTLKEQDYFLPAPAKASVVFKLQAKGAAPKTRLMFKSPLPAGRHQFRFELAGSKREQTFVIATPLAAGHSAVEVTIIGVGRFDFGFWSEKADKSAKEYRFTVTAPVARQVFELDFPAAAP